METTHYNKGYQNCRRALCVGIIGCGELQEWSVLTGGGWMIWGSCAYSSVSDIRKISEASDEVVGAWGKKGWRHAILGRDQGWHVDQKKARKTTLEMVRLHQGWSWSMMIGGQCPRVEDSEGMSSTGRWNRVATLTPGSRTHDEERERIAADVQRSDKMNGKKKLC